MIIREDYLKELNEYKDKPFIKVLTGLRRVGKSTILDLFQDELILQGIKESQILKINFELPEFLKIKTSDDLIEFVSSWVKDKKGHLYLMLDEVERVKNWERAVNAFHASKKYDIYITGSNADLLSSDLSTFLAGRYIELLVYPLSYKEFIKVYPDSTFKDYVVFGGMPHIIPFNLNYKTIMKALNDTYRSAIFQNVISRYNIRNTTILEKLLSYIFANPSKTFSALSISNYFKSEKINVSVDTVINYLKYCEDAYLIKRVSRKELPSKEILKTEEKFFIMDHSYREAIIGSNESSIELILENIVYIELLRRGYEVYVGKVKNYEIDFVAYKNNKPTYFQVTYLMENPKTREREFGVYKNLDDNYDKYVISMDEVDFSKDGIKHLNIVDFLLTDNNTI